jgi:hypothetical protein
MSGERVNFGELGIRTGLRAVAGLQATVSFDVAGLSPGSDDRSDDREGVVFPTTALRRFPQERALAPRNGPANLLKNV